MPKKIQLTREEFAMLSEWAGKRGSHLDAIVSYVELTKEETKIIENIEQSIYNDIINNLATQPLITQLNIHKNYVAILIDRQRIRTIATLKYLSNKDIIVLDLTIIDDKHMFKMLCEELNITKICEAIS